MLESIPRYTDSGYAFAMAHVHKALHRGRGLLTSAGKELTNGEDILILLEGFWLPNRVSIVHYKGDSSEARGHRAADLATQGSGPRTRVSSSGVGNPAGAQLSRLSRTHPVQARLTELNKNWPNRTRNMIDAGSGKATG